MTLERRFVDQLALSLFDKEATYDAGPAAWLAANACAMSNFDGLVVLEDQVIDDKEGVSGYEFGTAQEILRKGVTLEYSENRVKPNTLTGLTALHFGSITSNQDGAATAYRHRIAPIEADDATITASTIAFVDSNPDTITDSGSGFVTAGFKAGQVITVSGSVSNDGIYTIASVAAGTITLVATAELAVAAAGASVTITANSLPSIGALYKEGGNQYQAKGIKCNSISLKLNEGYFGFTASLIGSGTRASDSTAFPAKISEDWLRVGKIVGMWLESGANISISDPPTQGAEAISSATPDNFTSRLLEFEFTANNNLRSDLGYEPGGGDVRANLEYGRRDMTVTMKIKADSSTYATELAYYENQDAIALHLSCKMGTLIDAAGTYYPGFELIIPLIKLKPIKRDVQDDFHVLTFEGDVFDDGTNDAVLLYIYTAQSTYLA